ncbi:YadA-like family protein [Stenotrophomonas acidaminiphila]
MNSKVITKLSIAIAIGLFASNALAQSTNGNPRSTAVGNGAQAMCNYTNPDGSTSLGYCTAIGSNAIANGRASTAVGTDTWAAGNQSVVVGDQSTAMGERDVAIGSNVTTNNTSFETGAVGVGSNTTVNGRGAIGMGTGNTTVGNGTVNIGSWNNVSGESNTVVGQQSNTTSSYVTGFGNNLVMTQDYAVAMGAFAAVNGWGGVSIGPSSTVNGMSAVAIGPSATAHNTGCVAIGSNASCNVDNTVSFGTSSTKRRVMNIGNGLMGSDAAAFGQLQSVGSIFGAGAGWNALGVFQAPTYGFSDGTTHRALDTALYNLDDRVWALEQAGGGTATPGPTGPAGADGKSAYEVAQNNGYTGTQTEWLASLKGQDGKDGVGSNITAGDNIEVTDNADGSKTVALKDTVTLGNTTVSSDGVRVANGPSVTTGGVDAGSQRVTNVSNGRIEQGSMDAVNGGQVFAMQQEFNDKWTDINNRMDRVEKHVDDRMNLLGAQSAALTMASAASGYLEVGEVQINAGLGFQGNKKALAIMYRARVNERTTISAGGSFGSGGSPMAGFGVSFTLGR